MEEFSEKPEKKLLQYMNEAEKSLFGLPMTMSASAG
jgi:hypothetical protein